MTHSSTTNSLSRRTFAAGTAAGTLVAGLTAHRAAAQDTAATTPHPVVGTWLAQVTLNEGAARPALLIYHADGTLVAPQPPSMPGFPGMAPLIFVSPAAGVWQAEEGNVASVTFALLATDETGAFLGLFSFNSRLEVASGGMTYEQEYTGAFTDPAGNVMPMGIGAATANRIVVEPMVMPETATPAT